MKKIWMHLFTGLFTGITTSCLFAQMDDLHGDAKEIRRGLHDGNQFHVTFYNDGTFGQIDSETDIAGEWPAGMGHLYLFDGNPFVGSEVMDNEGVWRHIVSTVRSVSIQFATGDQGPSGEWWTFLPLPGFANQNMDLVAMSHIPASWPFFWPDKCGDVTDPCWYNSWNGYFGKNQFNADQESFFVADDYNNREFNFYPDTTDFYRGGLGIRMSVRGFQWSLPSIEDVLFTVFDLENIGTYDHYKMVFGYKVGNTMGSTTENYESEADDRGFYDTDEDLVYLFDNNDTGAGGWSPVGYFGSAFLESPGNPVDGIDNDNDGKDGTGIVIKEDMFQPRELQAGDAIVLIDYSSYERMIYTMNSDPILINFQNRLYEFSPGDVIEEIPNNRMDDNLNGLIDENNGEVTGEGENQVMTYLYTGLKCIDYYTGEGRYNPLIDERRDDSIDNDGDWDALLDDVGADGMAHTGDTGEHDGRPTPGEPNFDKTDVHESDQIGLTSFNLYHWEMIPHDDDEIVWDNLKPGYFNANLQNDNIELFFGSGYFSMKPDQTERISMALMCGVSLSDLMDNKTAATSALHHNYRLPKKPEVPVLMAVAHDHKVTLNWSDVAEVTKDPVTGYDFEGYRIYRSAESSFFGDPVIQFDLNNEYAGYSQIPENGSYFYLGANTGLQHSWVDTNIEYGIKYYYIVTSYDHGNPDMGIAPAECSKNVYTDASGQVFVGQNGAVVIPVEPSAPNYSMSVRPISGVTDGTVSADIVDPAAMKKGHTYHITFEDSLDRFNLFTKNFTLTDLTAGEILINRYSLLDQITYSHVLQGFRLSLRNAGNGILELNPDSSGWNNPGIMPYNFRRPGLVRDPYQPTAADFQIIFDEVGMDTSVSFYRMHEELPAVPVNFTVINLSTGVKVKFAFRERDLIDEWEAGEFTGYKAGRQNRSDEIIFLTSDSLIASWQVSYIRSVSDTLQAGPGDILTLKLTKPFLSQDVFEWTIPNEQTVSVNTDDKAIPDHFSLSQNYPNPFNPVTTIKYDLARITRVTLKIFNCMGQEVGTLVKTVQPAGTYQVSWNASKVSSGVYFYQIQADTYSERRKMLVIK
ncbi:T9SS type A sorting domain-containing protein [bacterium]|nr:T9SS type A sorting domain-containing protein [bacterium]